ncbi:MAG: chemotaxis response regulator protein-glutamate methylesterase [Candidatus Muiribacterium halophilum]|uniref:Protein-glutamate methylesterase/protein-glutamine glutaminase n=1 Tax=Muiribacterium halophilum TaxID=2053465 RepID=A0A2N5ZLG6_MUIH1|nr:MAG: chemotaxis response regulator protein-glutamate methylesterase [Candidatus Muirbacterium halophilum]
MIKVMVVDDSALMRKIITRILNSDNEIDVVMTARDGIDSLEKIIRQKPDVITLDVEMPRMDGVETLKRLRKQFPEIPVVMISSLTTENAELTLKCLELGAFDFVHKPSSKSIDMSIESVSDKIVDRVKKAFENKDKLSNVTPILIEDKTTLEKKELKTNLTKLVCIGISTGGPNALMKLIPRLPTDLSASILIVQHMPAGFTKAFSERLDKMSKLHIKEAEDGDKCIDGRVLIAPGDFHMKVRRQGIDLVVELNKGEKVNRHRPSADILFLSAAENFGRRTLGVIMTGMGNDGAEHLGDIRKAGGYTIAQDENSSVVYGMPRTAVELDNVDKVLPLKDIYREIIDFSEK